MSKLPNRLAVLRWDAAAVTVVTRRPFVNKISSLIAPRFGPFGPSRRVVMTRTKDNFGRRRSLTCFSVTSDDVSSHQINSFT